MEPITAQLEKAFATAIHAAFGLEADPLVSVAQNAKFGDYQSNAAMGLAKHLSDKGAARTNPRAVAEQIRAKLDLGPMAEEVSIAGAGFINVRLAPAWVATQLAAIASDDRLGIDRTTQPRTVVVDYSGPNVAKQMHVGHLRSTIIGDAISRVIEFQGHDVIRQNHIGDWGTQFGMLIAYLRSTGGEMTSHIADLEDFYRKAKQRFDEDPAFQEEARQTVVRLQASQPEELAQWRRIVDETRRHYHSIYLRLGVKLSLENERGESFYNPMLRKVVEDLREKGFAVESSEAVEGATAEEQEPALAARADRRIVVFNEGFKNPLIIQKTDGGYLYATTDLAAIRYRTDKLHARRIIYIHDARQAQHFAQVFATARRAGWAEDVSLEYAPFGTMLGEDGTPFKTRSGDTVKLKDLLEEAIERAMAVVSAKNPDLPDAQRKAIAHAVGIGGIKYADLSKDRVSDYVFAWDKMLALDGNTAAYLQYAHARVESIFRKAGGRPQAAAGVAPDLASPFELALAKHLLRLGEVVELVSRELKPHLLTAYLYELASRFSGFYENCPVLQAEEPARSSRLLLCSLTARTMALGLNLLGIEHPDQM